MDVRRKVIELHPAQVAFRKSEALYRGFVGGRGSGKSWAGSYDLARRARRGRTYLVASPTGVLLNDTTYPTFEERAKDLGIWASVRKTPYPTVSLSTGATIRFRSADDPERLRGPNLSGVWLDEASLMHEDAYKVCIASLREAGEQGWLSATFTPKGLGHWTYAVFGGQRPDMAIFHAQTRDNPFNPPEFQATLEKQYSGLHAAQELEGRFVNVEGAEWPAEYFPGDEALALATGENGVWYRRIRGEPVLSVLALDPSKGRKDKPGDYAAFVCTTLTGDGHLWVQAHLGRWNAAQIVEEGLALVVRLRPKAFVCETNQFQELLAQDFLRVAHARRIELPAYGIVNTLNKIVRVRAGVGTYLAQGRLHFLAGSEGTRLLVQQLRDFPCGEHDDGPDSLDMSIRTIDTLLSGDFEQPGAPRLIVG